MNNTNKYFYIIAIICTTILIITSCRPKEYTPKPKGYPKTELPEEHTYQQFNEEGFPLTFEYPTYSKITRDSNLALQKDAQYWLNVYFPTWDATIYLSYKPISTNYPVQQMISESFRLSFEHDKRADYIKTPEFNTTNGLNGVYYHVGGNAASAYQFYATDSTKHFIRGALYFNVTPNADSLLPATEFIHEDLKHLVNTLKAK